MFRPRGGCEGMGVAFGHFLCPLSGDFDHKVFPQTVVFLSLERDILSNLSYFLVSRVRNLTKKLQKKKKEKVNQMLQLCPCPIPAPSKH